MKEFIGTWFDEKDDLSPMTRGWVMMRFSRWTMICWSITLVLLLTTSTGSSFSNPVRVDVDKIRKLSRFAQVYFWKHETWLD